MLDFVVIVEETLPLLSTGTFKINTLKFLAVALNGIYFNDLTIIVLRCIVLLFIGFFSLLKMGTLGRKNISK